jgi:hypothetical protein
MPIRAELQKLYPPDWPQISNHIRFVRAGGRCEQCGRPHGEFIICYPDGRWRKIRGRQWYDACGAPLAGSPDPGAFEDEGMTWVVLACAHLDHDPTNNDPADDYANLQALCQRCHMNHDREHHRRQIYFSHRARLAIGDFFYGLYEELRHVSSPYPWNR